MPKEAPQEIRVLLEVEGLRDRPAHVVEAGDADSVRVDADDERLQEAVCEEYVTGVPNNLRRDDGAVVWAPELSARWFGELEGVFALRGLYVNYHGDVEPSDLIWEALAGEGDGDIGGSFRVVLGGGREGERPLRGVSVGEGEFALFGEGFDKAMKTVNLGACVSQFEGNIGCYYTPE